MAKKEAGKYIFIALILILILLTYLILKPLITIILLSALLAFIFHPLYKKLNLKLKNEKLSSLVTTIIIILIIALPSMFIINITAKEIISLYQTGIAEKTINYITNYIQTYPELAETINTMIKSTISSLASTASSILITIPSIFLGILITIFTTYYFLITGENIVKNTKRLLPKNKQNKIIKHLSDTTYSVIYGFFVISIIAFIISYIILKLTGLTSAGFWAMIFFFTVFFPLIGSSLIWIPLTIIQIVNQNYITTAGLIITGAILALLETFGRPLLIGKKAKIHPVIILLGVIGGIAAFGIIGIFIGPIILSLLNVLVKDYIKENGIKS